MHDYWAPDRIEQLSHEALVSIFQLWWTTHSSDIYEQNLSNDSSTVELAASGLGHLLRPEQTKFQEAVSDRVEDNISILMHEDFHVDVRQRDEKSHEEWQRIKQDYAAQYLVRTELLSGELQAQLEQELRDASQAELADIKALCDRMTVEQAEEELEDAERAKETDNTDGEDNELYFSDGFEDEY